MDLISEYSKTWAVRHLREAYVEYCHGKESQDEDQSRAFMAAAIRKAQLAFEHVFESPEYFELVVIDAIQSRVTDRDPKVALLTTLISITQTLSEPQMPLSREMIFRVATEALHGVSAIVEEMTSTRVPPDESD